MKAYFKEFEFVSPDRSYVKDITPDVNGAIEQTRTDAGLVVITSQHTTLGLIVNEVAEPKLLQDMVTHSMDMIGEDPRSTWVAGQEYTHPLRQYLHACMDSPLRPPDEIDDDFNAGRHLRAMVYSHPSIALPYTDARLALGRYQQLAIFEFDGRDGTGINPLRRRIIQAWIYPVEKVIRL